MDSKSRHFLDDPIGDLCELAAKLERYSLDLSAQPSPAAEKASVVLLGQIVAIAQEVVSIFVDPHALRESGGHNGFVALQGVHWRVGQGSVRLAEIADEFYAAASLYRNYVCAELSDQLRSLDADTIARLGFSLAPYGDDYHVSA